MDADNKMSGVYILSVLSSIFFVSVAGYLEYCTSESQCVEAYVCVANKCRCPVNQFYDGSICKDRKVNNEQCANELQCRIDLGLLCDAFQKKCLCSPGTWSSGRQRCETDQTCHSDVTGYIFDCWTYAEEFFKEQELTHFSDLMQFAYDTCGPHVGGVINCVGNVLTVCPAYLESIERSPTYANYTMLKVWSNSYCGSSMISAFKNKFDCVKQQVAADPFQTCLEKVPGPDQQSGLYPCSINSDIKSCLDSTVGTQCGQDAADAAATAVKLLGLKLVDGCPAGSAVAKQPVFILVFLFSFVMIFV